MLITGGMGSLGRAVTDALLRRGIRPLVVARREPSRVERRPGADYLVADLAADAPLQLPAGIHTAVHCAAETSGGWAAHERNSVVATSKLLDGMAAVGVRRLVHVSSLAVLDPAAETPLNEASRLDRNGRARGPYVWGKLEAEQLVAASRQTHGLEVRIVRPAALVDPDDPKPPGKLGRRIGPFFLAVGPARATVPTCQLGLAAELIAWTVERFDNVPSILHAIDVKPRTRTQLVADLRSNAVNCIVVWCPWPIVRLLSAIALIAQHALGRGRSAVRIASAFETRDYAVNGVTQVLTALESGPAHGSTDTPMVVDVEAVCT